ncbi:MAG: hypothetical protein QM764_09590 [Chitinophagaceae bacterium]
MKRSIPTYLLSFFFILLFVAKDIASVCPAIFNRNTTTIALQSDWPEEESENNKPGVPEKNSINECLHFTAYHELNTPLFILSFNKEYLYNTSFQRSFYGTVLTPPPDQS